MSRPPALNRRALLARNRRLEAALAAYDSHQRTFNETTNRLRAEQEETRAALCAERDEAKRDAATQRHHLGTAQEELKKLTATIEPRERELVRVAAEYNRLDTENTSLRFSVLALARVVAEAAQEELKKKLEARR